MSVSEPNPPDSGPSEPGLSESRPVEPDLRSSASGSSASGSSASGSADSGSSASESAPSGSSSSESEARPLRVAIVGAGPSGFYTADALLAHRDLLVHIDLIDRLPTPYGLVRGGVAPDHQKMKSVVQVFQRTAAKPGVRFFGNIQVGRDVTMKALLEAYDMVVLAVGNEGDRRLDIPGEDLEGSHPATAFVGWYNGHPDYRSARFDLSHERVAIVGMGNVALDVARILARSPEELATTDIADYALEALRNSKIREVILLGRRGPAQAAFSPVAIRGLGELESADLLVDPTELVLDETSRTALTDAEVHRNLEYLEHVARRGEATRARRIRLRFLVSPVEVVGEGGKVTGLKLEHNVLVPDGRGGAQARGTGELELLPVGLVFRAVGYRCIPLEGVPFDPRRSVVFNLEGRVVDPDTRAQVPGLYVVGWAKRGPTGLIGTNRADAVATVKSMLEDLAVHPARATAAADDPATSLFASSGAQLVSFEDWQKLDRLEVERGAQHGKVREKFTRIEEMLEKLRGS